MPGVSAIGNFVYNLRERRENLQHLFDTLFLFKHEIPSENPRTEKATTITNWLTDIENGLNIHFSYLDHPYDFSSVRRDFHLKIDHTNFNYDAFTYDVFLTEVGDGSKYGLIDGKCSIGLCEIDCYYVINVIMNLIAIKMVDTVEDLSFCQIYGEVIPKEKWMSVYKDTLMEVSVKNK